VVVLAHQAPSSQDLVELAHQAPSSQDLVVELAREARRATI
jgi:hypothetical protein